MSDHDPLGYDHVALRLKAMQFRNVERLLRAASNQRSRLEEDGLPAPAWAALDASVEAHQAILKELRRDILAVVKGSPLQRWVSSTKGLGPAVFLLLGHMPAMTAFGSPAKVWKYVGLHVTEDGEAPRRRKGERLGFNAFLRSIAIKRIAEPIMKTGGPYREVYDRRRTRTGETHPDWTLGHSHADALRVTAKAVLVDAWRVANGLAARGGPDAIEQAAA